jgi:hypothetical protein
LSSPRFPPIQSQQSVFSRPSWHPAQCSPVSSALEPSTL